MKVEFLHSQRMKISDQGIILELEGNVSELQDIASAINAKGAFHLPKGAMVRRDDFICIDNGRICIESDPHTLNQIMELGPKFQLPMPRSAHVETPTANRGYYHNDQPLPPFLEPLVPYQNREPEFVENAQGDETPLFVTKMHDQVPSPTFEKRTVPKPKNRIVGNSDGETPLMPFGTNP